ncbi:MAG: type II/IV secretion system protein [Gammaproteobacteria bacterium TMED112]|nr:MAG: type II/IV secretion system protein [Gammaproteobacteria bacterium TMED112]|tara:strand:+ start:22983 stop:24425 length:1443 start_codon:yes stop_codon:yes gene_type:complete
MDLPLTYNFCKTNKIALINDANTSVLHTCGALKPKVLSSIENFLLDNITKEKHTDDEFENLLTELYTEQSGEYDFSNIDDLELIDIANAISPSDDLLDDKNKGPIIKLINATITKAVKARASDIHLEPFENKLSIRFRVDGVLREVLQYQKNITQMIISRIKIMSKLDISERRLPQDGRISISVGKRDIDLRVSTLPSSFGERVVLRILEKDKTHIQLDQLGFSDEILKNFRTNLSKNEGIILVTGPTGSGKTTSLYSGLREISDRSQNILTIEDPVEYALEGIGQTQVNTKTGLTFAKGLRAILRQDPDIVMVGEIRDKETAEIAIQASLTGHLVLSTVHTNSAVNAITRLRDMGIEPYLLSSSLIYVLSQRLVRKLCPHCKTQDDENNNLLKKYKMSGYAYKPVGCQECENTGFKGRLSIGEYVTIDEKISEFIHNSASENEISEYVYANNKKIFENGLQVVANGETSISELMRVIED